MSMLVAMVEELNSFLQSYGVTRTALTTLVMSTKKQAIVIDYADLQEASEHDIMIKPDEENKKLAITLVRKESKGE